MAFQNWFDEQNAAQNDVVFTFPEGNLYAHRLILQQYPAILKLIKFYDQNLDSVEHAHGELIEVPMKSEDIAYKPFKTLLEFVYTVGFRFAPNITSDDVVQVYKLATRFNIQLLADACLGRASFVDLQQRNLSTSMSRLCSSQLAPVEFYPLDPEEHVHASRGMVELVCRTFTSDDDMDMEDPDNLRILVLHKGLISQRSHYFHSMFKTDFQESRQNRVMINQCSIDSLKILMFFVYTGFIPYIKPEHSIDLYLTTHQFGFVELQPYLRAIIKNNMDPDISVGVLHVGDLMNDSNLIQFCIHYVAKHLDAILDNEDSKESYDALPNNYKYDIQEVYGKKKT